MKKYFHKHSTRKIIGCIFLFIGTVIIFKVVPSGFFLFLLGLIFISIGIFLIKRRWI